MQDKMNITNGRLQLQKAYITGGGKITHRYYKFLINQLNYRRHRNYLLCVVFYIEDLRLFPPELSSLSWPKKDSVYKINYLRMKKHLRATYESGNEKYNFEFIIYGSFQVLWLAYVF